MPAIRLPPGDRGRVMTAPRMLLPAGKSARVPQNSISRPQIETIVSRAVAGFALLFAAQALPVMIGQFSAVNTLSAIVFIVAIYGGIVGLVVATTLRRFVVVVNAYLSFAYLGALVAWPFVALDTSETAADRPWLWLLCTVATSTAAIAFTTRHAAVYLILTPITYGVVRVSPSGGGRALDGAVLDVAYAVILGGAVLILITLLRQAAGAVDAAQAAALDRYSHAVRQHATEVERVQVDSIVHDSVLTTLLSAARAYSPQEKKLVTQMALNAMTHLKDAAAATTDEASTVTIARVIDRICRARSQLTVPFELHSFVPVGGETFLMPLHSAEALYSATLQALVNSQQHAGTAPDITRDLFISQTASGGILIRVHDSGIGFVPALIPPERLGLRVSIVERVASAGGAVSVFSAVGGGTSIVIAWPSTALVDQTVMASTGDDK